MAQFVLVKLMLYHKINNYIIWIALLAGLSTGVQIVFLGSLLPIILFVFFDVARSANRPLRHCLEAVSGVGHSSHRQRPVCSSSCGRCGMSLVYASAALGAMCSARIG